MIALALALVAVASPAPRPAATSYMIWGWGSESCGSWSAAAQRGTSDPKRVAYKAWLTGYVTAANLNRVLADRPDFTPDGEGMVGWVDNYCRAHPLETIADASVQLTLELSDL